MKEKQCPACMMVIKIDAKKCPHCRKKFRSAWPAKLFIGFVILWAIGFSSSRAANQMTESREAFSALSAERNTMHNMEETVHVGYTSYVVWKTWWRDRLGNNEYGNDKANASFLFVEVTILNDDNKTRTIPPFKLIDENGAEYKTTIKSWQAENSIGIMEELNPGVGKTGVIVFDVPKGHNYKLQLSGGYWSDERALIALGTKKLDGLLLAKQNNKP